MGRKHRPAGLRSQTARSLAPSLAAPRALEGDSNAAAKSEDAARNDWLRLAFDTSRDPLFLFDAERRLLDCNRAACRILARGKDELIGRAFAELSDWLAKPSQGKFSLTPRAVSGHWQLHGCDTAETPSTPSSLGGQLTEALLSVSIESPSGLAEQLELDVAARNASFNEFTGADPLVRNIIESLPVGVWVIDLAGEVVVANSAGRQIWGGARNDWRREGWWASNAQRIAQDQWPGPRVLATGEAVPPTEAEVLTFDQARKTLLVSATPLRNEQGRLLGAVCIHQDITSRVTAERAAQQEMQRSVHLERLASIGTLAAGIAHEINNPLGTILLSAELGLASLTVENEEQRRALTSIVADAKRCGRIVHNVLRFASRLATDRSPGDLNSVVHSVHQRIAEYAAQRGVTLAIELTARLPAVTIDVAAIEQAIMNVIRNAIDASADTAEARVEIRTQSLATDVRLIVRDYGPGVKAQDLPHLFDPFYTTRRNLGSVGLGLSVAHGIVRDHDGALRIESTPGHGATMYLDLPVAFKTAEFGGESP